MIADPFKFNSDIKQRLAKMRDYQIQARKARDASKFDPLKGLLAGAASFFLPGVIAGLPGIAGTAAGAAISSKIGPEWLRMLEGINFGMEAGKGSVSPEAITGSLLKSGVEMGKQAIQSVYKQDLKRAEEDRKEQRTEKARVIKGSYITLNEKNANIGRGWSYKEDRKAGLKSGHTVPVRVAMPDGEFKIVWGRPPLRLATVESANLAILAKKLGISNAQLNNTISKLRLEKLQSEEGSTIFDY